MVPLTRRRALQAAVGLLAGLAGCNGDNSGGFGPGGPSDSPTAPGRDPNDVERDPEHVMFRASEYERGEPIVWFFDDPADRPTGSETVEPHEREHDGFIASEETAATLTVADVDAVEREDGDGGAPAVDADGLRAFVDETDFERESLYLQQRPVEACYRRVLCWVRWDDDEFETRYGEFLRDHDVACETGAQDALATLIRIPRAVDPDVVESGTTGVSRDRCFRLPGERSGPTPSDSEDGTAPPTDETDPDGGDT